MCDRHLTDEERAQRPAGPVAFVDELVVAITNGRIYAREHPRVQAAVRLLHEGLGHMRAESRGDRIQIGAADGFVFHDGKPLLGASLTARRLLDVLTGLGAGGISFDAHTTEDELHALVAFLGRGGKEVERHDEANLALQQQGCRHVRLLPPYEDAAAAPVERGESDWISQVEDSSDQTSLEFDLDIDVPARVYQDVVGVLQDAMVRTCSGQNLDMSSAAGQVESILKQISTDATSMMRLARYEKYDAFTFGHSVRVCFIALNFARHLTQDPQLMQRVGLAALMHDIGKAWVPFDVLHSTERLTDAERAEMNMHPVHGGQILLDSSDPDPLAVAAAFSHHQNHAGGGYPRSVRLGPPSAATMIVKICDVYEALTAVRPYKPRLAPTRAYRIMMDMDGYFDSALLRRFIEANGIYPVGTRVELSTGERARVTALTDRPLAPIVRTEEAASGEALFPEDVRDLDLRTVREDRPVEIAGVLLDAEL